MPNKIQYQVYSYQPSTVDISEIAVSHICSSTTIPHGHGALPQNHYWQELQQAIQEFQLLVFQIFLILQNWNSTVPFGTGLEWRGIMDLERSLERNGMWNWHP